jgi:hypothetical protein
MEYGLRPPELPISRPPDAALLVARRRYNRNLLPDLPSPGTGLQSPFRRPF